MQNEKREPELMDDAFDKLLDEFLADQMSSLEGDNPDAESCNDDKANDETEDYDYDEDDICEDDDDEELEGGDFELGGDDDEGGEMDLRILDVSADD